MASDALGSDMGRGPLVDADRGLEVDALKFEGGLTEEGPGVTIEVVRYLGSPAFNRDVELARFDDG